MRTIRTKVYQFSELSKQAKQNAIDTYLNNENFDWIQQDASNTLEKFCQIFDITINSFDFTESYRNSYNFEMDDNILELSSYRLAKYIWNNYKTKLYKGKYFSLWSKKDISYKYYKEGHAVLKSRYSKVILDNSCVLTGVCYDESILQPIYDFLNNPTNTDFKDLLENCLSSICKDVIDEIKGNSTEEAISEHFEANEYEFTKDGNRF